MKKLILGLIVLGVCTNVSLAQPSGRGGGNQSRGGGQGGGQGRGNGVPQEAITACSSKSAGDSCTFSGREGKSVTGTCIEDGDDIACAPEGMNNSKQDRNRERSSTQSGSVMSSSNEGEDGNQSRGGQGNKRTPPQEAITACSSKSAGDSCTFSGREGDTVSGTCIEDGEDIACAPEGHGQGGRDK